MPINVLPSDTVVKVVTTSWVADVVTCVSDACEEEVTDACVNDDGDEDDSTEEGVNVEKDVTVDTESGGVKVDVVSSVVVSRLDVEDVVGLVVVVVVELSF